ncbi:MAG: nucleoside deaminase [Magnetococcus sp. WYHC-3]
MNPGPLLGQEGAGALLALAAAHQAGVRGEVPVGAVLLDALGRELACAGNRSVTDQDPVGHAELVALRQAGGRVGNYRLPGTLAVVSVFPCPMCLSALAQARVAAVCYSAPHDHAPERHRQQALVVRPLDDATPTQAAQLMKNFFELRR